MYKRQNPYNVPFSSSGGAAYFNGSSDYLASTVTQGSFDPGTAFTFECWVYPTSFATQSVAVSYSGGTASWSTAGGLTWALVLPTTGLWTWQWNNSGLTFTITSSITTPLNAWTNIAVTYNGTTTTLWINGVSAGTSTSPYTLPTTRTILNVGALIAAQYYSGYISNLRFIKGTAVYTSTFTPSTTPLTAITNTALLTCQSSTPFVDNSTNAFTITRTGTPMSTIFGPFNSTSGAWSIYQGVATDLISLPTGATAGTNFQFAGNFTIEGWIYCTNSSATDNSFYVQSPDGTNYLAFNININGGVYNIYLNSGGITSSFSSGIPLNAWTHVAMVRNGSTITVYTNGAARGTITNSSTVGYASPGSVHRIGGGNPAYRYVSNLRIVNGTAVYTGNFTPPTAPLTAITNTVLLTCQSNYFKDNSTNNFAITASGSPTVSNVSPFTASLGGGSMYLNGSGSYFTVPYVPQLSLAPTYTSNFTLEMWVYPTGTGGLRIMCAQYDQSSNNTALFLLGTSGTNWVWYWNPYNQSNPAITSSSTVTPNNWYHVAIVNVSGTHTMYVNGISVGSVATSSSRITSTNITFGNYLSGGAYPASGATDFAGYISNCRVTNGVARYTSNFALPTAALPII